MVPNQDSGTSGTTWLRRRSSGSRTGAGSGDLFVIKIAGGVSAASTDLEEVYRVASKARDYALDGGSRFRRQLPRNGRAGL